MAWQQIGSVNLVNNNKVVGYVYLEYDTASSGSTWSTRVRIGERQGYWFSVRFDNFTVNNVSYTISGNVTQNSGTIWSGTLGGAQTVVVKWKDPWYSGTSYMTLTGYLPAKSTTPTGLSVKFNYATWNSVNITSSVTSWGTGYTGTPNLEQIVVDGTASPSNWETKGRQVKQNATSSLTSTQSVTTDNSIQFSGGFPIKGLTAFKIAAWASTSAGTYPSGRFEDVVRYTPPAPSTISYNEISDSGDKTFTIVFAGVAENNSTSYDTTSLTRTVRYKIGNGDWVYVVDGDQWAVDAATTFTVIVPASSYATIEGWQSYKGQKSETASITVSNNNLPIGYYGSVNNQSKKIIKYYGSLNGVSKKIIKYYGSKDGVARKVFEDV